jgi:hypothetical protein
LSVARSPSAHRPVTTKHKVGSRQSGEGRCGLARRAPTQNFCSLATS